MERDDSASTFERILKEYGAALGRIAGMYEQVPSSRDDLLQEISIAIWRALPRFRGECSQRTFVFRIAHNRCATYLSRKKTAVARSASLPDTESAWDMVRDTRLTPEAEVLQKEQFARVKEALFSIPLIFRQVLTLSLEGLSHAEIAETLGISPGNVAVRLNRARKMISDLVGGE